MGNDKIIAYESCDSERAAQRVVDFKMFWNFHFILTSSVQNYYQTTTGKISKFCKSLENYNQLFGLYDNSIISYA